ncbi:MAG: TetR/AcrR family transcriptional regulator [Candidatus Aureabacteria bacterium]|nr:TetR/AcrR family transcriptional regulator [Candidatus Auribacterota bacterium]
MKITDKAKKKELIQTRQKQILDVASRVFSKKGFASTQVDEIADLAGLGKGTVYRYFKNKKNLFLSVVDRGIESLKDLALEAMAKEKEPLDKIKKVIEVYLKFFEKQSDLIRIFIHEQSEFQKRIQKRYYQHYYEHVNKVEEIFKEAQSLGLIKKKIKPSLAIAILTDMLNSFIYTWQLTGKKYSLSESFTVITEIYFTGILEQKGK